MILTTIDFKNFFTRAREIFSKHFSEKEVGQIMEYVEILSDANFRCYRANMIVIDGRKKLSKNPNFNLNKLIADMEWVARSVGEYRVSSKARINLFISKVKSNGTSLSDTWISDDVVYSIGEMIDRLSIETIKREDFRINNRPIYMINSSQELSSRVEKYLIAKLDEVDRKGFYECIREQRTYDIEGITEELII